MPPPVVWCIVGVGVRWGCWRVVGGSGCIGKRTHILFVPIHTSVTLRRNRAGAPTQISPDGTVVPLSTSDPAPTIAPLQTCGFVWRGIGCTRVCGGMHVHPPH